MRYRNTMLLAIAIFCCDLQVVNSAEQYNNINWDEIYKLPNKEIVHLDDIMYENQKQFITKNNGNIKLELFNFHHKLTVNKLNYMYDSISYENEAAKSCIKS